MRKYFITGLLVLVPLAITLWVLNLLVTSLDQTLQLLPPDWQPRYHVPGLGVLLTVLVVFATGVFASNAINSLGKGWLYDGNIAQLVIQEVCQASLVEVATLPGSHRGTGGFGSTGGHAGTVSGQEAS